MLGRELPGRETRTGKRELGYLLPVGESAMLHVRVRSHRFYVPVGSVVDETINYSETALVTDLIHEFYYRKIGKNYDVLDNG